MSFMKSNFSFDFFTIKKIIKYLKFKNIIFDILFQDLTILYFKCQFKKKGYYLSFIFICISTLVHSQKFLYNIFFCTEKIVFRLFRINTLLRK